MGIVLEPARHGSPTHPYTPFGPRESKEERTTYQQTESAAAHLRTHGARRRAEEHPLLTVAETARMLRVSEMTVRRACDAGDLPFIRFGRARRISRGFVQRLLDEAAGGAEVDVATGNGAEAVSS